MIAMACYALNARSQTDESRNFVYLYSDSVIHAERIRLRPDFVGSWVLRADSRRVPLEQVKFFNNEDGFFANTRRTTIFGSNSFSERIIKGKINLFQEVAYDPVPFEDYYRFRDRTPRAVSTQMYYNKGFSDIKKVSYAQLKMDMADNPRSLDFLESYRKGRQFGTVLYVTAGVAILASLVNFFSEGNKGVDHSPFPSGGINTSGKSYTASFLLMGISGGLAVGGYLKQAAANRQIEMAIDTYNRN